MLNTEFKWIDQKNNKRNHFKFARKYSTADTSRYFIYVTTNLLVRVQELFGQRLSRNLVGALSRVIKVYQ